MIEFKSFTIWYESWTFFPSSTSPSSCAPISCSFHQTRALWPQSSTLFFLKFPLRLHIRSGFRRTLWGILWCNTKTLKCFFCITLRELKSRNMLQKKHFKYASFGNFKSNLLFALLQHTTRKDRYLDTHWFVFKHLSQDGLLCLSFRCKK